jgi:hypothetical protein
LFVNADGALSSLGILSDDIKSNGVMSKPNVFQRICVNYHGLPKTKESKKILHKIKKHTDGHLFSQYKNKQHEQKKAISKEEAAKG